ncbi:MAG: hypothetical protein IJP36_08085 [Bacteroides sp.]|nr:hypothetical protein [Bacteroides sp.]
MKRNHLFYITIITFSIMVFIKNYQESSETNTLFTLNDVEAIGACETSYNHEDNVYYCTKIAEIEQGVCVETGSGKEPRCSGNI